MVRAMSSSDDDFKIFFENNVVAVGWRDVDFTKYSNSADLRNAVWSLYYENSGKAENVISRKLNEVERFKSLQNGDIIIVPYNSFIAIAEATETERYSDDGYELDLANQRVVTYRYENNEVLIIPRNELSEGLQRRLRVRGNTVSNLFEFKDEIELIFGRKSYSYSQEKIIKERDEWNKFESILLKNIQLGKT